MISVSNQAISTASKITNGIMSAPDAAKELGISIPTARTALNISVDLKIVESEDVDEKVRFINSASI